MLTSKLNNHIEKRVVRELEKNLPVAVNYSSTDKVAEALIILAEECAEVVQEVCKIQRFGIESTSHHTGLSHKATLAKEVADVLAMVDILVEQGVITYNELNLGKLSKIEKLKKWSKLYE